ncbi:MAG: phosphorylase [Nitrospirae bacterium RBG_13_39_12]|nr:MAG: phosphorylase [Nitrospirae bacterium RBG_13_39_12]
MSKNSKIFFNKGTLWQDIVQKTQQALDTGALLSYPTDHEFVEDRGIRFLVRILTSLQLKDAAKQNSLEDYSASEKAVNPFLPYDERLFVADISETHVALLNKFNVVEYHLLIVTRHFEKQETLLTLQDFTALWACMSEYNGLGFYNGGDAAGASQPHKHLQIVPLPLFSEGPEIPIEPLLTGVSSEERLSIISGFPFLHVFARLENDIMASPSNAARRTFELYSAMLSHACLESPSSNAIKIQSAPYCLLITRKWMLLIPRFKEFFDSISINSLAFAGSFFVRNKEQMDTLKKYGPMTALNSVALPFPNKD